MAKHTSFFKTIDRSQLGKPRDRRQWGFGLNTFWVPLMTALNVEGVTAIPSDALGAPLRLRRDKETGEVKFGNNGKPSTYVAVPIAEEVRAQMEAYEQRGLQHVADVAKANAEQYSNEVRLAIEAGAPIMAKDQDDLSYALEQRAAKEPADEPADEPVRLPVAA